jgi:hypothetical protein
MIEQVKDVYQWRVVYQDGTVTDEYDNARPDGRGFGERKAKPVAEIRLMTWHPFNDHEHRVDIPDGATAVFFRRRSIVLNPTTGEGGRTTVHCIGWKREQEAVYLFVFDDSSTLLTSDLQAV